jgi:hypothetical protein
MPPTSDDLVVTVTGKDRVVDLDRYVSPDVADLVEANANTWIKQLRHARVDATSFRDRFTVRGDSLWWFAELYLHKHRVVARALRTIKAMEGVLADGRPAALRCLTRDPVVRTVIRAFARHHRIAMPQIVAPLAGTEARLHAKAILHTAAAFLDRVRPASPPATPRRPGPIVAFVHSAFARAGSDSESYIGPLLESLEEQRSGGLYLVGVGPRTSYRVRQWRDRLNEFSDPGARHLPFTPIEAFAGWRALGTSRRVWRERARTRRALEASSDIREHSMVSGVDLWRLVRVELAGIANLQFPWSARAMDEAAAALTALAPSTVLTYAEAGGWGRAIMLEARRLGIPSVGVQHGFIYRHWLNYLHEPDEVGPSNANPHDRGFPRPDRTLLFDGFAAEHLMTNGSFPPDTLSITGSTRLERFGSVARALSEHDRRRVRHELGVPDQAYVLLVAAKHTQLGWWFRALVDAAAGQGDLVIVVKTHPAEDGAPYLADARGAPHVRIAPPHLDLPVLTAVARVLVTAHSTAAIEAMAVGVPALVVGLPSNLTPFVTGGAMAGVHTEPDLAPALSRLVHDEAARQALAEGRAAFLTRYGILQPPGAAGRAAQIIGELAER